MSGGRKGARLLSPEAREQAAGSLRLDAGRSNDFDPFRALLGDEGSKLAWRVPLRHDSKGFKAVDGFRPFKIRRQRGVELSDDRLRRSGAGEKALPAAGVVTRHRFGKRRYAGEFGISLDREHGEHVQFASV